jgi:hypothetical protein
MIGKCRGHSIPENLVASPFNPVGADENLAVGLLLQDTEKIAYRSDLAGKLSKWVVRVVRIGKAKSQITHPLVAST